MPTGEAHPLAFRIEGMHNPIGTLERTPTQELIETVQVYRFIVLADFHPNILYAAHT